VRNESEGWNASRIVQEALEGIGFGGGHADMAGGIIREADGIDGALLRSRFLTALQA
jgi:nanoRNase/pAp phosphatase (c-di-AMP/oligoRNAs hydrolase)